MNRFAVQMLVQSPDFAIYIYSSDAFTRLLEKMGNFCSYRLISERTGMSVVPNRSDVFA
ncbi:hypothetical protein TREVI0001_2059 [Treponema vincentii ATCC 35580]|uniref:Uncharacterized protein n=1 Tax=Treponema vincentii ATCC 35580 TaxID=596324 RepID=C8PQF5_9SPIR|nr:hypothetical protein TREVI0001_2059 [Treponema vincentii ATCC 35580]